MTHVRVKRACAFMSTKKVRPGRASSLVETGYETNNEETLS
jgi:hypothetical protein